MKPSTESANTNLERLQRQNKALQKSLKKLKSDYQKLQESQLTNDYRSIFNSTNDAIFVHNKEDGKLIDLNDAAVKMYGYSKDEIIGKDPALLSAGGVFSYQKALKQIMKAVAGKPQVFDWYGRKKNGEEFWVKVDLKLVTIGGTKRILSIIRDIDEQKKAQDALVDNEERYRALSDATFEGAAILQDGYVIEVNDTACKMFGYARDEFIGLFATHVVAPGFKDLVRNNISKGYEKPYEAQGLHKNGNKFWVEFQGKMFVYRGQKVRYTAARDITRRKKEEFIKQKGEELYRNLFELSPAAIFLADKNGVILDVNPAYLKAIKFSRKELIGSSALRFANSKHDTVAIKKNIKRILAGEQLDHVVQNLNKNGKIIYMHLLEKRITLPNGEIGILSVAEDITESTLAKHTLLKRQTFSESLLRLSRKLEQADTYKKLVSAIHGEINKILEINNVWLSLISKEPYVIKVLSSKGPYVADLERRVSFDDPDNSLLLNKVLKSKTLVLVDDARIDPRTNKKIVKKLENITIIHVPLSLINRGIGHFGLGTFGDEGVRQLSDMEKEYLESMVQHITVAIERIMFLDAQQRSKEILKQNEERYRVVVEASPDAVSVFDATGKIIFCNERKVDMFGYKDKNDLIGRNAFEMISKSDLEKAQLLMQKLQQHGLISNVEFNLKRKDNSIFPGEFSGAELPTRDDGEIHYVDFIRDLTQHKQQELERKNLEIQIQHAQKLESLGILAGGIAHDFNNILTGILGNIGLAEMELPGSSPALTNLSNIEKSSLRAAELCRQLLAYSGKGRFVVKAININDAINDLTPLFESSVSKKAILRYNFSKDLSSIEVDITQIRQVILNLVINASDAIGDNSGIIIINTGQMFCDQTYLKEMYFNDNLIEGNYVFVEVVDDGSGMDNDTLKRIFDPFFTTKFTGRGLGLAAVLGIIRGHNGAIKIKSQPEKGTSFRVLFPCSDKPAVDLTQSNDSDNNWQSKGTVLVVDDEEAIRVLGKNALEKKGFNVLCAEDGKQALSIYKKNKGQINLVLLDMTMPHLNGEETFKELQRINKNVKVVLSSGYNQQQATNSFTGKGLAGFLQKPYKSSELLSIVRSVLDAA